MHYRAHGENGVVRNTLGGAPLRAVQELVERGTVLCRAREGAHGAAEVQQLGARAVEQLVQQREHARARGRLEHRRRRLGTHEGACMAGPRQQSAQCGMHGMALDLTDSIVC